MKLVIFDIDGVLADFEGRLVSSIGEEFGWGVARLNPSMYFFGDRYKEHPEVVNFATDFVNNRHNYRGLEVLEDGLRFVREVEKRKYPILFCTSRPKDSCLPTNSWLERNVPFNKWGLQIESNKAKWIYDTFTPEEVAFIVDDNPDVCHYLNRSGFLCFCWRQPWNESVFPAIIPTRDEFFVVEDDADEGINLLAEMESLHE